ncbi:MAG: RDD family protein [Clostridium celatum]|nr:RDD family protein [Clostridium celatum]
MRKQQKNQKSKNKSYRKNDGYDIGKLRARRFVAMIVDWYITSMIAAIPVTFHFNKETYISAADFQLANYDLNIAIFLGIFAILSGIIYYLAIPMFIFKGQTLGKKLLKIKVVKQDKSEVDVKTILIREVLGSTLFEGGIVTTAIYLRQLVQLFVPFNIFTPWTYLAYIITIISIVIAYFNKDSLTIHDKIAKTILIKV